MHCVVFMRAHRESGKIPARSLNLPISGESKQTKKQKGNKMELPNPGSYTARQNGKVLIVQETSGSLMAYIPYALTSMAFTGTHSICLVTKVGEPMTKNLQTLKAVFPAWEHEAMADIEMPAEGEEIPQFELADCYHDDTYIPEGADAPVIKFQAKWFNVAGGMRKAAMTDDERKAARAKWGAKFKALLSKPATTAVAKTTTAPAAKAPAGKPAVSGPPGRKATAAMARTSTQEEVWTAFETANGAADEPLSEDDLAAKYYDACDSVVEGSSADPALLKPAQWGQVAEALGV
jgi:hypothetical protein